MIDTEHLRDVDVRTQTPPDEDPRNARRPVQVAAVDKLHLTVDGRTLCGLVTVDELDLYSDEVALRAWNIGPLEQCAHCATALVTRIRRPARTDLHAADRRTGDREHPAPTERSQLIGSQGRGT
jgi:hypothetical protein